MQSHILYSQLVHIRLYSGIKYLSGLQSIFILFFTYIFVLDLILICFFAFVHIFYLDIDTNRYNLSILSLTDIVKEPCGDSQKGAGNTILLLLLSWIFAYKKGSPTFEIDTQAHIV